MTKNTLSWLLLLLLASIWGSSFILMKRGMESLDGTPLFSAVQVGALRMSIAGTVLLPFSLLFLRRIKTWKHVRSLLVVGFAGSFIPAFLFTYAETGLSSGYAGMLNSFTPVFTMLVGAFIFRQPLNRLQVLGVAIAGIGIVLLMIAGKQLSMTGSWYHIFAIILATFLYGISLNTVKHTLQGFKSLEITSLSLFFVLVPALVIAYRSGTPDTLRNVPQATEGLGFICILSIASTAFAGVIYNRLISISSTLFASSTTYFMPIVAIFFGLGFGEPVNIYQIGAMAIVLSGVFIGNYLNKPKIRPQPTEI
jgi:drug/metabolite transporter (DMT)-like permease